MELTTSAYTVSSNGGSGWEGWKSSADRGHDCLSSGGPYTRLEGVLQRERGNPLKIRCAVDLLSRRTGRRVMGGQLCGCEMDVSSKAVSSAGS